MFVALIYWSYKALSNNAMFGAPIYWCFFVLAIPILNPFSFVVNRFFSIFYFLSITTNATFLQTDIFLI
jgi:hypothetical protein